MTPDTTAQRSSRPSRLPLVVALIVANTVVTGAMAAPGANAVDDIPAPLKPWVGWVLAGHESERCPDVEDGDGCVWPGVLDLTVGARSGTFEQRWTVLVATKVPLPGGEGRWPEGVVVDGSRAPVLADGGSPWVQLTPGEHLVRGRFTWDEQPERLSIPEATALFSLSVNGRAVLFPRREGADVYLDRDVEEEKSREADSLDVAIFRKIVDDAPLTLETRLVLDVAGKAREVSVPGALLAGFEAASVSGPVPVRIEGTSLRAQVRPGSHTIVVVGRSVSADVALTAPPAFDDGPAEEIWVYEPQPSLRIAHIEGPPSIAADQTRLASEWKRFAAYRLLPGETLKLVEDRRGDADPPPSQLNLNRTIWLDFDGSGATVRDEVTGSFNGDRLEMGEGTTLGHVTVSGTDGFITALNNGPPGVEVRQRNLNVVGESRIDGGVSTLPAVSWRHDFQSATIDLNLPPGFSLLNASGVDSASDTWIKRWTLFEIFLVVVLVAAMLRLWGPLTAGLAGVAFVLTFQEDGAPMASWVVVVVLAALHRALPEAWRTRWGVKMLAGLRLSVAVIVGLMSLGFAIEQVRVGMYPVLEAPWRRLGSDSSPGRGHRNNSFGGSKGAMANMAPEAPPPPPPMELAVEENDAPSPIQDQLKAEVQMEKKAKPKRARMKFDSNNDEGGLGDIAQSISYSRKSQKLLTAVDPNAVVQTGPGLPSWTWNSVSLRFSGPVAQGQQIELTLLSPTANLVLAFVRVFLLLFLILCALGLPGRRWPAMLRTPFRGRGAIWTLGLALLASTASTSASAQIPDEATLNTLRERLLKGPACGDQCISVQQIDVEAQDQRLRLRFEVHAGAAGVVALPANDEQWTPRSVTVDGRSVGARRDDNAVLVRVDAGVHDIVAEGPLPRRDTVQISLPMKPRHGAFRSSTWSLDGIHEDGVVDENLQLNRLERGETVEKPGELPASVLPAFMRVERTVLLGLTFEVETRVLRLSPTGTPVVVDVPLLAGESVTTDGIRTEKGVVKVSLGPNDTSVSWHSNLGAAESIALNAPKGVPWLELWTVQESPLWHVTKAGIPPIHQPNRTDGAAATWRPWPGETLTLSLQRPSGVTGQTLTVDAVTYTVTPGLRSTDAVVELSLRASRGGQHPIRLPAGAELLEVSINGGTQPLRADNDVVTIPLSPGAQRVRLKIRLQQGVAFTTSTPTVDIGQPGVNVTVGLELPSDRWILFAWGTRTGPAVLFWSMLAVIIITAIGLSRISVSPLKAHQWVLLSLGLTQVPVPLAALVAGWLLALGWRKTTTFSEPGRIHNALFSMFQLMLVGWTLVAVGILVGSIHEGLLGSPDMQISGNGSSGTSLLWFADRLTTNTLPTVRAWSLPILAYRIAMLVWALWLALAFISWLREGFKAFGSGGFFRDPFPNSGKKSPSSSSSSSSAAKTPVINIPEQPSGAPTSAAAMSLSSDEADTKERSEKTPAHGTRAKGARKGSDDDMKKAAKAEGAKETGVDDDVSSAKSAASASAGSAEKDTDKKF